MLVDGETAMITFESAHDRTKDTLTIAGGEKSGLTGPQALYSNDPESAIRQYVKGKAPTILVTQLNSHASTAEYEYSGTAEKEMHMNSRAR